MADKSLHQPGVYCIRNLITDQRYIGSSTNIFNRWVSHRADLRNNKRVCRKLQAAWNKYGEPSFSFEILEVVADLTKLVEREQHWVDILSANRPETGYNTRKHASTNLGNRHSEASKASMSRTRTGHSTSDETKAKISAANKGRVRTPEMIERLSKAHLGYKPSIEARAKLSAALKGRKRGPLSPEHQAKLIAANKGRKLSAETRAKMSEAHRMRWKLKLAIASVEDFHGSTPATD